jgi:glycosyltransferase involved in cell wall biosynthesis
MAMSRLLYITPHLSSFVLKDIAIFEKEYTVIVSVFKPKRKILIFWEFIKQLFFLVGKYQKGAPIVIMFAGYHSVLPAVFGQITGAKILIVTGGTDCVGFKAINYGNFIKFPMNIATRYSLKNCSYIAPVHESLVFQEYTYDPDLAKFQGHQFWIPECKTPVRTIYNAYDTTKFFCTTNNRPENTFVTVANVDLPFAKTRKGLDLIYEWAEMHPEFTITLVGVPVGWQPPVKLTNLKLINFVGEIELLEIYNRHQFYLQLSVMEGFPNALTEAMMCGCIPVVSDVASMPFIADGDGVVVKHRDLQALESAFFEAKRKGFAAHNVIAEKTAKRFPLQNRERELLGLVAELKSK